MHCQPCAEIGLTLPWAHFFVNIPAPANLSCCSSPTLPATLFSWF
jgi:hypothetical protein